MGEEEPIGNASHELCFAEVVQTLLCPGGGAGRCSSWTDGEGRDGEWSARPVVVVQEAKKVLARTQSLHSRVRRGVVSGRGRGGEKPLGGRLWRGAVYEGAPDYAVVVLERRASRGVAVEREFRDEIGSSSLSTAHALQLFADTTIGLHLL